MVASALMENLFAPWRRELIEQPQPPGCLFCRVQGLPWDDSSLVVFSSPLALVMLNRYPYNAGHVMVAPLAHVDSLEKLDDHSMLALFELVARATSALTALLHPDGFNVGMNLGSVAGAGIPGHLHVHVVPRWAGDTNFMPVLGATKVINEHLSETRQRLEKAFRDLGSDALPPPSP